MSARASPVCGRAYTMLSILTASTRCSEDTGSPVNGDRSRAAAEGEGDGAAAPLACPPWRSAINEPATRPASRTAAATAISVLCRAHIIARSRPRLDAPYAECAACTSCRQLCRLSGELPRYQTACLPASLVTTRRSPPPRTAAGRCGRGQATGHGLRVGEDDPDLAAGEGHRPASRGGEGGALIGPGPRPVPGPDLAVPQDQRAAGPGALREGRAAALLQEPGGAHR